MAGAFQARRDWSAWRTSGRLAHLVHPDYAGADEAWRMFPNNANDCLLMVNPRLREGSPEVAAAATYGAEDSLRRTSQRRRATAIRAAIPDECHSQRAGDHARDAMFARLTDALPRIPAVIAAAGPSLDAAIGCSEAMTGRALLIAVDTALRPLLDAGITPQLVGRLSIPSLLERAPFPARCRNAQRRGWWPNRHSIAAPRILSMTARSGSEFRITIRGHG